MTVLFCMYGSPSSGKTSLCAKLFGELKALNIDCEFVGEYVKSWVYEGKKVNKYGQFTIFGEEVRQQSRLFNVVDVVISDSPVALTAFYNFYYNHGDSSLDTACKEFYRKAAEDGVKALNFYLPRKKKYVTKGRYQSEEQANDVNVKLQDWLQQQGYNYYYVDCPDKDRLDYILNTLKKEVGDLNGMALV